MSSKIIQDISHYQQFVDFAYLKTFGQNKIFLKAASGSLFKDDMFEEHYKKAIENGWRVSAYFWADPIYDAKRQAQFFLDTVKDKQIDFIVLDFEHFWKSWSQWQDWVNGKISQSKVERISPDNLLNHLSTVYEYIHAHSDYKIVIYTAPWFINTYCPKAYDYLKDKYTWWADYTLFNTTKEEKTWEQLEQLVPSTNIIPTLPKSYPIDKTVFFQCSGDKYSAKGVYSDKAKTRLSRLDLNKEINSKITWNTLAGISSSVVEVPISIPTDMPDDDGITIPQNANDKILKVVYKSQLTGNSQRFKNDCGAAVASQIIDTYTKQSTDVDDLFVLAVPNLVDRYLTVWNIKSLLAKYNIPSSVKWTHDLGLIRSHIDEGRPSIAVIRYKYLQEAGYCEKGITFIGNHYVTVVGYNDTELIIHDPLYYYNDGAYIHIPNTIFSKALNDPNCGMIIVPDNPINGVIMPVYKTYVVNNSMRNVRDGAGTNYNIIGTRVKGDKVRIDNSTIAEGLLWGHIYDTNYWIYMGGFTETKE